MNEDFTNINKIRNFAIIAHIDHGKSTLADRILEQTGAMPGRNVKERVMDTLDLEQERGITIKLQTARMHYHYSGKDPKFITAEPYILNLVDTPGHVDFSYEVSRSLAASEGAILLVDASQGIQAQTLTTVYKALEYNLEIIPVINKIDLPNMNIEQIITSLVSTFGFKAEEIIKTSGKTGTGVTELLNRIIEKIPSPALGNKHYTRALIYDSFFHDYKGVVALVKVTDGEILPDKEVYMLGSKTRVTPIELGYLTPSLIKAGKLQQGEIGYLATGLKDIKAVHVGDTITMSEDFELNPEIQQLPGYQPAKPMVFATLFPVDADDFSEFQEALGKLALNDAALSYVRTNSQALGSGFLCGFLGLLHMEITQERLEREFNIDLITTLPTVEYKLLLTTKDLGKAPQLSTALQDPEGFFHMKTAAEYPDQSLIQEIQEPWVNLEILTPENYIGPIMDLVTKNRGNYKKMEYISDQLINKAKHVLLVYEIPSAEIVTNFFDKLKSLSQGYASMDYTFKEYVRADIVKVSMFINHEIVEAMSFLTHRSNAERKGRELVSKLVSLIPRQQFPIPVQAAISGKIFARETIKAYRKDVIGKLSGGDVSRKIKLLEKQKKGKKKLKMIGKVQIPQDVFLKALKI